MSEASGPTLSGQGGPLEAVPASLAATVVIPSYSDADVLEGCLRALESQTVRQRLTVIVSLDGGEPLPDWIGELADSVIPGEHAGPATARNRGWRSAETELVLFTDSDCRPAPDWAERLIGALGKGLDAVKGAYSEGGSGMIQRLAQVEFEERYSLLLRSGVTDMVDTYSAGFRRSCLEAVDGFDESFPCADHEDVDLSYRLLEAGFRLGFAPLAKVSHVHRRSWGSYFRMKLSRGRWRSEVLRRFPAMAGGGSYTPVCLKVQMMLAGILPAAVLASLAWWPSIPAWIILFLASCIPLGVKAIEFDPGTLPLVPAFCLVRGSALFLGMVRGIFTAGKERG